MKDELFNELIESVREGGAILRGKTKPSRTFVVEGPNIKHIRTNYQLSQGQFAALLGISRPVRQFLRRFRRNGAQPGVEC